MFCRSVHEQWDQSKKVVAAVVTTSPMRACFVDPPDNTFAPSPLHISPSQTAHSYSTTAVSPSFVTVSLRSSAAVMVLFCLELKWKQKGVVGLRMKCFDSNDAWYYTWVSAVPPNLVSDLVPSALTCVFFALVVQASSASAQLKYVQVSFHFPNTPKSQLYIFVSVAQ